ncbi:AAA family ATPase [Aeromonas sobria]|jgi:predicted ATP-binding protein involved in virulence|uniref:AAA family ATPase n=1 Tax=Aeromonas sobria TaxID=646 RepID=UPI0011E00240|nr:AAA family ATPase [Aeromonas sobria]
MKIDNLLLKNFRCFEEETFSFDDRMTVIIGNNTSGKTSLLEAVSVAMGGFLLGIPHSYAGVTRQAHTRNIVNDDVRRYFAKGKEVLQAEFASPVYVSATGSVNNKDVEWIRYLEKSGSRTNNAGCKSIQNIATELYGKSINEGGATLPILMHYGTGRLWAGQNTNIKKLTATNTALGYYYSLKPDAQNKLLMPWIEKMHEISRERDQRLSILDCVYNTITHFIPDSERCYFSREHDELTVVFNGKEFPFSLLSDGQRNVISLVGDIAMRCAHLNQHLGLDAAKKTPGIVSVDELDTNIHPNWQKTLIPSLKDYFENIQFIVTTHSPFVIQSLKGGKLIDLDRASTNNYQRSQAWKQSVEEISLDLMHVKTNRSKEFQKMMNIAKHYYELLNNGADMNSANVQEIKNQLDDLQMELSDDPAYVGLLVAERRKRGLE